MRDIVQVQRAKEALKAMVGDRPWYRGVGIAPHNDGPILRLNVAVAAPVGEIPTEFEGIPIEVVRLNAYDPRT